MSTRGSMRFLLSGCALALVLTLTGFRWEQAQETFSPYVNVKGGTSVPPQSVTGSDNAAAIHRMVTAYFYAIGENRLEKAMSFYHEDSPQAAEARRELVFGQSAYLQRTSTLSLDLVHQDAEHVVVLATHRHLRIAGIKFMEEFADTRYVLRRQGGTWKLWSSAEGNYRAPNPLR